MTFLATVGSVSALKINRNEVLAIFFLLALITTISNLGFERDLVGVDIGVSPAYIRNFFEANIFTWGEMHNYGMPIPINLLALPWIGLYYLFSFFGTFAVFGERIFFFVTIFAGMFSAYYLFTYLFKGSGHVHLGGALAGVVYTFNPFFVAAFVNPTSGYQLLLALFPLLIAGYMALIDEEREFKDYLLFSLFLILGMSGNIAHFVLLGLTLASYSVYKMLLSPVNPAGILKKNAIIGLLFVLLSAFAWLPVLSLQQNPYQQYVERGLVAIDSVFGTLNYGSQRTSFFNLFTLDGMVWVKDLDSFGYISSGLSILSRYLMAIVAISALLLSRNAKKEAKNYLAYFFLMLVAGLFLTKGMHEPFGFANQLMYYASTAFWMFRGNYDKFGIFVVIPISLLFGYAATRLYELKKTTLFRTALSLVLAVLVANSAYLFVSGQVTTQKYLVDIPKHYDRAFDYLNAVPSEFKIVSLPSSYENGYYYYYWYFGSSVLSGISHKQVVDQRWLYDMNVLEAKDYSARQYSQDVSTTINRNLLSILNVKYAVVNFDWIDYLDAKSGGGILPIYGNQKAEISASILGNSSEMVLVRRFGNLSIYKVRESAFLPRIYAVSNATVVEDSPRTAFAKAMSQDFDPATSAVLQSSQATAMQFQDSAPPKITFKKSNPAKYVVRIEEARDPFLLVLSEYYHPKWTAYAEDEKVELGESIEKYGNVKVDETKPEKSYTPADISFLLKKPLPDNSHLAANAVSNAWYVDPRELDKDGDGNFVITLHFLPQLYHYLGFAISAITLLAGAGCVLFRSHPKKGDRFAARLQKRGRASA